MDDVGEWSIRANRGHSFDGIDLDSLCGGPIFNGEICCHGTLYKYLAELSRVGLLSGV